MGVVCPEEHSFNDAISVLLESSATVDQVNLAKEDTDGTLILDKLHTKFAAFPWANTTKTNTTKYKR